MSLIKCSVLLAVVGLALGTTFAQQKSAVATLQQAYQSKGQALCATYQKSLDSLLTVLKQKGDLDNYLIVETEKKRVEKKKTVPVPSEAKEPFRPVTIAYYKAFIALQIQYIKALDEQIKKEVIAGRIEDAKVLKTEKDQITFLLTENQALVPAETVAVKAKPDEKKTKKLDEPPKEDLLLYFTFTGEGKANIPDESGNGLEGMIRGGCIRTSRGSKGALKFDGNNDFLVTREKIALSANSPWTMSVWFKACNQPQPYDNIMSIGRCHIKNGIYAIATGSDVNNLNINLWSQLNYTIYTGFDYSKDFMHVAVTYDGDRARLYVNGVNKDSRQINLSLVENPVFIGGGTGGFQGQYFDGIISEAMIFKRALTEAEIESLFKK